MDTDKQNTYKHLVNSFYKLYPDKVDTIKVCDNLEEINGYLKLFSSKLKENNQYFSYLLKRNPKLFKALKFSLLPKIKMEVVLTTNESQDNIDTINEMWKSILLLYILGEADSSSPDKLKMAQVAGLLDSLNNDNVDNTNIDNNSGLIQTDLFKSLDMDTNKLENMMQSMGLNIDKNKIDDFKNTLKSGEFTELMTQFNKPLTEKSNQFINNVLSDVKSKFNLTEKEDGKVDAKQFVSQLINIGNNIGDTYSSKLGSEIDVNEIISAIGSIATNPSSLNISDLTDVLKLDKLDMNETIEALKEELKDKIPLELLNTLGNLDVSVLKNLDIANLKNLDMNTLLSLAMGGGSQEQVRELTPEERAELLKYYETLNL